MSYYEISRKKAKATKRYLCIWCGESIVLGTTYIREFSKFYDEIQFQKFHPECDAALADFFQSGEYDEFSAYENERPPTDAEVEYRSWDCSRLLQLSLI
jgi:hypothetical protein